MNDKQRIIELESVLARFLTPIKNIPFSLIVRSMSGKSLLPIELSDPLDAALIAQLAKVATLTAELVRTAPIRRNRPNEVGNDIEPFVMKAATAIGLAAERPRSASGKLKSTGYPDILLREPNGRATYLECKIFGEVASMTTMRSFYLSPSEDFKVSMDARHLLLAFGMNRKPISGSRDSFYTASSYKLVDLSGLNCDVKYEFNSDNRRLYQDGAVLAYGTC